MSLNRKVHDFFFGKRRKPPPTPISIPNFAYPKYIYDYLMSQSSGYKITFTKPDGNETSVNYSDEYQDQDSTFEVTSSTTPASTTTPIPYEKNPAYSTTAKPTPTKKPPKTPSKNNDDYNPPPPTLSPNMPPFWLAAINAMIFLNTLAVKIDNSNDDYTRELYNKLKSELPIIMGGRTDPKKNLGALVFFNTVVVQAFIPFNKSMTYNYLNGKYPYIFPDGKAYTKICMLNFYANHSSTIFKKFKSGYVSSTDKVCTFMIPRLLDEVLKLLGSNIDDY